MFKKGNKINLGRKHTEKWKKEMSESMKGNKNHFYNKKHTEKTKLKMSKVRLGKKNSEHSLRMQGKTPWNKGLTAKQYDKIYDGKKHWHWSGDSVGYCGIHDWLTKEFGKANKCENPDCSKKSITFQWAKLRDKEYERKRENFWMLCASCHQIYDNN